MEVGVLGTPVRVRVGFSDSLVFPLPPPPVAAVVVDVGATSVPWVV
jgi:hypothetical protein